MADSNITNAIKNPIYEWNDQTNEIRLHNGTEWLVFPRARFTESEAKLSAVRQLLEDDGINKQQIFMFLSSLDNQ